MIKILEIKTGSYLNALTKISDVLSRTQALNMSKIELLSLIISALSVVLAPIVALWIGGIIQRKTDRKKEKLAILSTLLSYRYQTLSPESIKSLNLIDVTFSDEQGVRDAWSKYYAALSDNNLNQPLGISIRSERRQELITEIIKSLGLERKIAVTDILRAYQPTLFAKMDQLAMMELDIRLNDAQKRADELGLSQWANRP